MIKSLEAFKKPDIIENKLIIVDRKFSIFACSFEQTPLDSLHWTDCFEKVLCPQAGSWRVVFWRFQNALLNRIRSNRRLGDFKLRNELLNGSRWALFQVSNVQIGDWRLNQLECKANRKLKIRIEKAEFDSSGSKTLWKWLFESGWGFRKLANYAPICQLRRLAN